MADLFWTLAMVVMAIAIAAGCVLLVVALALGIRREFWNVDGTFRDKPKRDY